MERTAFKEFSFQDATFVFNFSPIGKIERHAYEFESTFQSIFEQEVVLTKVPEGSPLNIPRFILRSKNNRSLEVSEVNAIFKITFKVIESSEAMKIYVDKTKNVFSCLKSLNKINFESFKVSSLFHYSLKNMNYSVGDAIFDRFFKIEKPTDFHGISFVMVQKIEDITFKNIIDSYEIRQQRFDFKGSQKDIVPDEKRAMYVKLVPSEMKVIDKGLSNKINVDTDNIIKDDSQGSERLFNKTLNWPIEYISKSAEEFIFGGK